MIRPSCRAKFRRQLPLQPEFNVGPNRFERQPIEHVSRKRMNQQLTGMARASVSQREHA